MREDPPAVEPEIIRSIEAVLAGRSDAFVPIIRRFQDSVMTVAVAILRDRQAATELTQDVFVRAFQQLSSFDRSRPMKPWLIRICYRLAQDRWRSDAVDRRQLEKVRQEPVANAAHCDALVALITEERNRKLWEMVEALPRAERTATLLYYREGLSVDEVAEVMAVATGTIKTLLFRARAHLRSGFAEHDSRHPEGIDL